MTVRRTAGGAAAGADDAPAARLPAASARHPKRPRQVSPNRRDRPSARERGILPGLAERGRSRASGGRQGHEKESKTALNLLGCSATIRIMETRRSHRTGRLLHTRRHVVRSRPLHITMRVHADVPHLRRQEILDYFRELMTQARLRGVRTIASALMRTPPHRRRRPGGRSRSRSSRVPVRAAGPGPGNGRRRSVITAGPARLDGRLEKGTRPTGSVSLSGMSFLDPSGFRNGSLHVPSAHDRCELWDHSGPVRKTYLIGVLSPPHLGSLPSRQAASMRQPDPPFSTCRAGCILLAILPNRVRKTPPASTDSRRKEPIVCHIRNKAHGL